MTCPQTTHAPFTQPAGLRNIEAASNGQTVRVRARVHCTESANPATISRRKLWLPCLAALLLCFAASKCQAELNETQAIRALYGESCGEPYAAKLLVAATIRARGSLKGIYGGTNRQLSHINARAWNECVNAWNESASVKSPYRYFGGMIDDHYFQSRGMTPALTVGRTRFYE